MWNVQAAILYLDKIWIFLQTDLHRNSNSLCFKTSSMPFKHCDEPIPKQKQERARFQMLRETDKNSVRANLIFSGACSAFSLFLGQNRVIAALKSTISLDEVQSKYLKRRRER